MHCLFDDIEDEYRPLYETGIAYNLVLLECHEGLKYVDDLSFLINSLDGSIQKIVTDLVDLAFMPQIPFMKVESALRSALGQEQAHIIDLLVAVKLKCPPWPWRLLQKNMREQMHPKHLLSSYFELKIQCTIDKLSTLSKGSKTIDGLRQLKRQRSMTCRMVYLVDDGLVEPFYTCRIFCREDIMRRSEAFKVALYQVQRKDPLTLVHQSALNKKSFDEWEKPLVALYCTVSNMTNTEFLNAHISDIPREYHFRYQHASVLAHHRKKLEECQRSLRKFYFSKREFPERDFHVDPMTASTVVSTVMTNYARLYIVMVHYAPFFKELQELALRVGKRLKSKSDLLIFLNQVCDLTELKDSPQEWSSKLNNSDWNKIVQEEEQALLSLFEHKVPVTFWGYYIVGHSIPSPKTLIAEFIKVRERGRGKFESLTHDDIVDFSKEIHDKIAIIMLKLLEPLLHKPLPPGFLIKNNHPYEIYDQCQLELGKKLEFALSLEQGTFTNELFINSGVDDFASLEKLHLGLAYHFETRLLQRRISKDAFLRTLDDCYPKPITKKKFEDGKKIADQLLKQFNTSGSSLPF